VLTAFVTDRRGVDQTRPKTYLLTLPLALDNGQLQAGLKVYQPPPIPRPAPDPVNVFARFALFGAAPVLDALSGKAPEPSNVVARVTRFVRPSPTAPNRATGVLAELTLGPDEWSPNVYGFGPITRAGIPTTNSEVLMVGASAVLRSGRITATGMRLQVVYGVGEAERVVEFNNLIAIQANPKEVLFAQPGDLGAPVLTKDLELVGVVLAGARSPNGEAVTYALPIKSVLDALGVELLTQPPKKGG
jgi:hypothetical protein